MNYKAYYESPLGMLTVVASDEGIKGVWFHGQNDYYDTVETEIVENLGNPFLIDANNWLDEYFKGKKPYIGELKLAPEGSEFRQAVWKILLEIPYGETITYGEIATKVVDASNKKAMSAQAVGGAVGHNPISIIIPCHRVIGRDGSLTGYAGGLQRKAWLLEHEGVKIQ